VNAGRVLFVGCGPGAADLLTLRAIEAIERADIVIWSPSLIDRQVLVERMRPGAEIVAWPPARQPEILAAYDRAVAESLLVVRLKGGDPGLFGGLEPELSAARERGLGCEIVPGVSALSAGAAALGCEVATPEAPLLLVDAAALADAGDDVGSTIAVHGASAAPGALQRDLLRRGLPASTPCVVALEISRRDETLVSCTLEELAETLGDMALGVLGLVIAGVPATVRGGPATS
jgi:precorrin-4/cobalt-precorrin-4 C11-methyltransferase